MSQSAVEEGATTASVEKVARVAILGGESTGKSTLAAALATHFATVWVPEYLREFVEAHNRTPRSQEQFGIATMQVQREDSRSSCAQRWLFCDTTPLMTAIYSRFYFGAIDIQLQELANTHPYDFTIVTAPTTPWMPDGLQRDSDTVRLSVHELLLASLQKAKRPFLLVEGDVMQRVQQTVQYLTA